MACCLSTPVASRIQACMLGSAVSSVGTDHAVLLQTFVWKAQLDAANNEVPVDVFDMDSLFYEPGQRSYMRDHVAYTVSRLSMLASSVAECCMYADVHPCCWWPSQQHAGMMLGSLSDMCMLENMTAWPCQLGAALLTVTSSAPACLMIRHDPPGPSLRCSNRPSLRGEATSPLYTVSVTQHAGAHTNEGVS